VAQLSSFDGKIASAKIPTGGFCPTLGGLGATIGGLGRTGGE
jgi:hypothetical protein